MLRWCFHPVRGSHARWAAKVSGVVGALGIAEGAELMWPNVSKAGLCRLTRCWTSLRCWAKTSPANPLPSGRAYCSRFLTTRSCGWCWRGSNWHRVCPRPICGSRWTPWGVVPIWGAIAGSCSAACRRCEACWPVRRCPSWRVTTPMREPIVTERRCVGMSHTLL